jgi:hypothetical protein
MAGTAPADDTPARIDVLDALGRAGGSSGCSARAAQINSTPVMLPASPCRLVVVDTSIRLLKNFEGFWADRRLKWESNLAPK